MAMPGSTFSLDSTLMCVAWTGHRQKSWDRKDGMPTGRGVAGWPSLGGQDSSEDPSRLRESGCGLTRWASEKSREDALTMPLSLPALSSQSSALDAPHTYPEAGVDPDYLLQQSLTPGPSAIGSKPSLQLYVALTPTLWPNQTAHLTLISQP